MYADVFQNVPCIDQAGEIESVSAATLCESDFKKKYVGNNRPVLIKNAVKHWRAITLWKDKEYLKRMCGSARTQLYSHMNYTSEANLKKGIIEKDFSSILDVLWDPNTDVASSPNILIKDSGCFSELKKDIGNFTFLPSPSDPLGYPAIRCFMYKSASTGWHFHHTDETLMCQIVGSKKTALIAPLSKPHSIVKDAFVSEDYLHTSECFDIKKNEKLMVWIGDVDEGDAMYIPPFWWHAVSPSDNKFGITVARCWRSPLHIMGDIRYPAVREMWKKAFLNPGPLTLMVSVFGLLSLAAIVLRQLKQLFVRA